MKVSFEYTKKEYEKYLIRSRKVNNIVLFIIGIAVYLLLSYNKISLIYLPLFILVCLFIIILINKLYLVCYFKVNQMLNYNTYGKYILELTPNKFSLTVNNSKTDYKYNKIKKIIERKKYFKVKFEGLRDYLVFEKIKFNEDDYNKIIKMFKEKVL